MSMTLSPADQAASTTVQAESELARDCLGDALGHLQNVANRLPQGKARHRLDAQIADVAAFSNGLHALVNSAFDQQPAAVSMVAEFRNEQRHGSYYLYPANRTAQALCDLLGTKTLSFNKVDAVKALGYTVCTLGTDGKDL